MGKEKRVRGVLSWALANSVPEGGRFVSLLLAELRACGGFREESPNFVGSAIVDDAISVFAAEGFVLGRDGTLYPRLLSSLGGRDTSEALRGYINRIRAGYDDSALVVGTGKDLVEATAAHVLVHIQGDYPKQVTFRGQVSAQSYQSSFRVPARRSFRSHLASKDPVASISSSNRTASSGCDGSEWVTAASRTAGWS